ncbi:MAG: hypothetical protein SPF56_08265 [Bacteroidaceae bacterium]|nr:hypothetical protein [Prevotellaceae bacterium]MDY5632464.1 hypothetical protein [Bacteroidaceae bacterium]
MKKTICYFALLLLSIFFVACNRFDNYGYPSKITFGREGGTRTCEGEHTFYHVDISDYNGNDENTITEGENDTIVVTKDWLSVKYRVGRDYDVKIIASPNTTGKKRSLYVSGMVDNSFADIKVTQNR